MSSAKYTTKFSTARTANLCGEREKDAATHGQTAIFHIQFFIIRHLSNTYSKLCSGIGLINLKSDGKMFTDTCVQPQTNTAPAKTRTFSVTAVLHTHVHASRYPMDSGILSARMRFSLTRTTETKNCKETHTAESTDCVRTTYIGLIARSNGHDYDNPRPLRTMISDSCRCSDSALVVGFRIVFFHLAVILVHTMKLIMVVRCVTVSILDLDERACARGALAHMYCAVAQ